MTTILYNCVAKCGQQHALCWLNTKGKKVLGMMCDRRNGKPPKFERLPSNVADNIDPADIVGIPEHSTQAYRKKESERSNLGLELMYVQPGEQVERTVVLPPSPNERLAIQVEVDRCVEAQKSLTQQIEKLARKRQALEDEERKLRRKLREVFTEPLNLTSE